MTESTVAFRDLCEPCSRHYTTGAPGLALDGPCDACGRHRALLRYAVLLGLDAAPTAIVLARGPKGFVRRLLAWWRVRRLERRGVLALRHAVCPWCGRRLREAPCDNCDGALCASCCAAKRYARALPPPMPTPGPGAPRSG